MKGVFRVGKTLAGGDRVHYHYTFKGGKRFWTGHLKDGPDTPGYEDAYRIAMGIDAAPRRELDEARATISELADAWTRSREWSQLAPRTQKDYERGLRDVRAEFGGVIGSDLLNDPECGDLVLTWIEDSGWTGKSGDLRLDALKLLSSWLVARKRAFFPRSQLYGIKKFYRGGDRSEIVWTNAEVELLVGATRPTLADAVVFTRDTGLRPGDVVRVGPNHIRPRADGGKAIIIKTNKGKRYGRVANIPLTARAQAIVDSVPPDRKTVLINSDGNPWKERTLGKEVRIQMDLLGIRRELRFYDLRGTRATELIWGGATTPELALQMGWNLQTAAQMMAVYGAMNPDAIAANPFPQTGLQTDRSSLDKPNPFRIG